MRRLFWKLFFSFLFAALLITVASAVLTHWQAVEPADTNGAIVNNQFVPEPSRSAWQSFFRVQFKLVHTPNPVLSLALGQSHFSFNPWACLLLLGMNIVLAALLAWQIAYPIHCLTARLYKAADEDLQSLLESARGKKYAPFFELSAALDALAMQLNHLINSQKTMLHHVSHELRSPLARIQMAVGLAQQDVRKTDSSIHRIALETARMETMIAGLLEMSRLESGGQRLMKAEIDMKALLNAIVNDVRFESEQANIYLWMPDEEVWFFGQVELLQRAVGNVIRNAVKYGPADGIIRVELKYANAGRMLIVSVQDTGNGVSPNELNDIFRPFVRGRGTSQVDGHGIGLAMTKSIAEAHGGTVQAVNLNPGFLISLYLPIEPGE